MSGSGVNEPAGTVSRGERGPGMERGRCCEQIGDPVVVWFRYAARFAIAAAAGLAIGLALGLEDGYWVLITIAVVIKPQLSLSTTSTIHRVGGTVLGALIGVALVISVTAPGPWWSPYLSSLVSPSA